MLRIVFSILLIASCLLAYSQENVDQKHGNVNQTYGNTGLINGNTDLTNTGQYDGNTDLTNTGQSNGNVDQTYDKYILPNIIYYSNSFWKPEIGTDDNGAYIYLHAYTMLDYPFDRAIKEIANEQTKTFNYNQKKKKDYAIILLEENIDYTKCVKLLSVVDSLSFADCVFLKAGTSKVIGVYCDRVERFTKLAKKYNFKAEFLINNEAPKLRLKIVGHIFPTNNQVNFFPFIKKYFEDIYEDFAGPTEIAKNNISIDSSIISASILLSNTKKGPDIKISNSFILNLDISWKQSFDTMFVANSLTIFNSVIRDLTIDAISFTDSVSITNNAPDITRNAFASAKVTNCVFNKSFTYNNYYSSLNYHPKSPLDWYFELRGCSFHKTLTIKGPTLTYGFNNIVDKEGSVYLDDLGGSIFHLTNCKFLSNFFLYSANPSRHYFGRSSFSKSIQLIGMINYPFNSDIEIFRDTNLFNESKNLRSFSKCIFNENTTVLLHAFAPIQQLGFGTENYSKINFEFLHPYNNPEENIPYDDVSADLANDLINKCIAEVKQETGIDEQDKNEAVRNLLHEKVKIRISNHYAMKRYFNFAGNELIELLVRTGYSGGFNFFVSTVFILLFFIAWMFFSYRTQVTHYIPDEKFVLHKYTFHKSSVVLDFAKSAWWTIAVYLNPRFPKSYFKFKSDFLYFLIIVYITGLIMLGLFIFYIASKYEFVKTILGL